MTMASERASGFERPGDIGAARGSERDTRENSVCSYIRPPPPRNDKSSHIHKLFFGVLFPAQWLSDPSPSCGRPCGCIERAIDASALGRLDDDATHAVGTKKTPGELDLPPDYDTACWETIAGLLETMAALDSEPWVFPLPPPPKTNHRHELLSSITPSPGLPDQDGSGKETSARIQNKCLQERHEPVEPGVDLT